MTADGRDHREIRVEDRMRRAWAQLLREMASEDIVTPNGADLRIREVDGDLIVTATITDAPIEIPDAPAPAPVAPRPAAKPSRAKPAEDDEDDAGLSVRRGPATD